jgi:hypothetical protein
MAACTLGSSVSDNDPDRHTLLSEVIGPRVKREIPPTSNADEDEYRRTCSQLTTCLHEIVSRLSDNKSIGRIHVVPPRRLFNHTGQTVEGLATVALDSLDALRLPQFMMALDTALIQKHVCASVTSATLNTTEPCILQFRWLPMPTTKHALHALIVAAKRKVDDETEDNPSPKKLAPFDPPPDADADAHALAAVRELRVPQQRESDEAERVRLAHGLFGCDHEEAFVERADDHRTMRVIVPIPRILSLSDWETAILVVHREFRPNGDLYFQPRERRMCVEWQI